MSDRRCNCPSSREFSTRADHVFSLLLLGERPQKICFGLFGLTVLRRNGIKLNYKNEIITAFCGPFVNIAICVCALLFYLNYRDNQALFSVVAINAALALFNLLPVSGLDGGRILECVLLKRFSVRKIRNNIMCYVACCFNSAYGGGIFDACKKQI